MNSTIVPANQALTVYIGQELVPQTDGHNQDGWSYADPTHTSITFSGKFCTDWVNSTSSEPTVGYYCPLYQVSMTPMAGIDEVSGTVSIPRAPITASS
jgi:hypothetical protein